jgi:hypothetical protein
MKVLEDKVLLHVRINLKFQRNCNTANKIFRHQFIKPDNQ